jgi:hypothetical protein
MLTILRPMIETAVRHGLGSLATLLLASAASNPTASAVVAATGLSTGQLTNAIVGGGMAIFVAIWSYTNNLKVVRQ